MNNQAQKYVCNTASDLENCLMCDPSSMPTVSANLRNMEAPINQSDVNFLSGVDTNGTQIGVDFFSNDQQSNAIPRQFSTSPGFVRSGLRFRTDFVLDSVCVIVHCEPAGWSLDGNQAFTQALINAAGQVPYSPVDDLGDKAVPVGAPNGSNTTRYGISGVSECKAQLEFGHPTWRAAHYFLQAFRLAIQCPSAANIHEIVNERLVDLGNCCLGTEYEGFGRNDQSQLYGVQRVNQRLRTLVDTSQVPTNIPGFPAMAANFDLGYFLPFNCVETFGPGGPTGAPTTIVNPVRMRTADSPSAYGNGKSSSPMYKWFRLPIPRIIKHDENIETILKIDPNDADYWTRMIHELAYVPCSSVIPGVNWTTMYMFDGTYTSMVDTRYVRVPGGMLRIGVAFKGWILDANLCSGIKSRFDSLSLADWRKTAAGAMRVGGPYESALGPMLGQVDVTNGGTCGCSR